MMRDQPIPSMSMLQSNLANHGITMSTNSRMYGMNLMSGAHDSISYEFDVLSKLKTHINKAYKSGKYCDVTLKACDGVEIKAHKIILASQNKHFEQKIDSEPEASELQIEGVTGDSIKVIVDYIYTQKVKTNFVNKNNARDILKAAEIFELEEVQEEAAIFMARNLDEDNAIDVMTNKVFSGSISNNAFTYVANYFQRFFDNDMLKKRLINDLKTGQLCHLLSQKNLMLWDDDGIYLDAYEREKELFSFVMEYINHDTANRLKDLKKLLTCLKLPLLIIKKVLTLPELTKSLKLKSEKDLSGMISETLEPFLELTGKENLSTLFVNEKSKKRSQAERRMLADTCKMRYASIPHSTTCSDLIIAEQAWGERRVFCPGLGKPKIAFNNTELIESVTVFTSNSSLKENQKPDDSNQFDRRVSGISLKFRDGNEETIGVTEHHTSRNETYELEKGEFITAVYTHHPVNLLNKPGRAFEQEICLTSIHDLSFKTNKERRLGPMEKSDLPLAIGLTLKVPGKIRNLEKNCPGKFFWLQGFGVEEIKIPGSRDRSALFPIWGFKTHFKVYAVKNQEFDFVAGIKKLYQFSIEGMSENPRLEDLEDIYQIERSPVHEVVDLDSDSNDCTTEQSKIQNNDESIMVVDSESDDEDKEESEEDSSFLGRGVMPLADMGYEYPPLNFRPPLNEGQGCEDEPIEIESSSEGEEPNLADVEEPTENEKNSNEDENSKDLEVSLASKENSDSRNVDNSTTEPSEICQKSKQESEKDEKLINIDKELIKTPERRSARGGDKGKITPNSKKKENSKETPDKSLNEDSNASPIVSKRTTRNKENGLESPDKLTKQKEEEAKTTKQTPNKKERLKRGAEEKSIDKTLGKKKKRLSK